MSILRKILLLLVIAAVSSPVLALAETDDFTKIFYYTEGKKSFASFKEHAASIDVIAPQAYGANAAGKLSGSLSADFLQVANDNGVKIMPLVVNSNFSSSTLDKLLHDRQAQYKLIDAMVAEAKKNNYWGWQFDFEQMTADRRDLYSAFVKRAYPIFKKNNLVFSVAVIAQHTLDPQAYPKNLWWRVIGAYDYKVIGQNSDFVSIMAYDQPDSVGPVASLDWVEKVVHFAVSQMSNKKISLGIPFYFWKWDNTTGKLVDIGGYGRMAELTTSQQVNTWGWDTVLQVAFVNYTKAGNKYTAWYENAQSFQSKLQLAQDKKLAGFSAWALGLEDPKIYEVIKTSGLD